MGKKYETGEQVLCYHGPLLYEAKCLDSRSEDGVQKYFVHYNRWNKNWDEWVSEERIVSMDNAGLELQKELLAEHKKTKRGRKQPVRSDASVKSDKYVASSVTSSQTLEDREDIESVQSQSKRPKTTASTRSHKSKGGAPAMSETDSVRLGEDLNTDILVGTSTVQYHPTKNTMLKLQMDFPDVLRDWLNDDCDLITRQAKLLQLPVTPCVEEIMRLYEDSPSEMEQDMRHEFALGILNYFELMLGSQLLYKFERIQYGDLVHKLAGTRKSSSAFSNHDFKASKHYGVQHLLRLLVKLSEIVEDTKLDGNAVKTLQFMVQELLNFLAQNTKFFSASQYINSTTEYGRRAMC